ncbi:hypothetical protein BGZ81_004280 [Podila clonocystis]|nr:hypothetical protein BGZ81_004280 [Podila clonocystis]
MKLTKSISILAAAATSASLLSPVAGETVTLSVMTFNVFFLPNILFMFNWGQSLRARRIADSKFIKGHDVLVVEECFDYTACDILRQGLLAEYPYQTPTVGERSGGTKPWSSTDSFSSIRTGANGGVVIFSKWPIKEQRQFIFNNHCGIDGFSNKGFAQVILDYNGTNLHVYGTHMQSDDSGCGKGVARQKRERNLEHWRKYIDGTKVPANELIILAGDFNIERNTAEFNSLLTNFDVDQPDAYLGHPHTLDTLDNSIARANKGPSEYLDYVLLDEKHRAGVKSLTQTVLREKTSDFKLGMGTYNDYSDHYPVHAVIQVDLQK